MKTGNITDNMIKKKTKYQIICNELREQIVNGKLHGKMPSMRDLTKHYQVSHVTVLRVFKELATEGLIESREKSTYAIKSNKKGTRNLVISLLRPLRSIGGIDNLADEIHIGVCQAIMENRLCCLTPPQILQINHRNTPDEFFVEAVRELEEYLSRVHGILLDASFSDVQVENFLLSELKGIPVVIIGRKTNLPVYSVEMPTENGCREAARLVVKSAYSKFILCQIANNADYRSDHVDIFADELKKNGCSDSLIHYCPGIFSSIANDAKAAAYLLDTMNKCQEKPFIFSSSGRGADWIMELLKNHGYKAGKDYGLLAFDGKACCYSGDVQIAAIRVNGEELGQIAVRALTGEEYQPLRQFAGFKIDINETL